MIQTTFNISLPYNANEEQITQAIATYQKVTAAVSARVSTPATETVIHAGEESSLRARIAQFRPGKIRLTESNRATYAQAAGGSDTVSILKYIISEHEQGRTVNLRVTGYQSASGGTVDNGESPEDDGEETF